MRADLIIRNARLYTGRAQASAVAIAGARILAVGDGLHEFEGPHTRVIDAAGATLLPGFIDAHAHMLGLGMELEQLDFRRVSSVAEIAARVAAEARRRPPGEWIRGRSWDQTNWGGTFPTEAALSAAAPSHPVCLRRVDGHAAWVNRKALALAGITRDTADPPGGRILRDAHGQPTGVLIDRAQELAARHIPAPTPAAVKRMLAAAAAECARLGLTGVHDAGVGAAELAAYRELIREGRLPLRIYAMIGGTGALWQQWLARGPETGEFLTVRAIKLMADGALGSRGAALKEPYTDEPSNRGLLILSRQEIEAVARQAAARGFQVCTHAIGDRANRTVLDAYAAVLLGPNDRRFRIEHAQVVAPEDIPLFARYSIVPSMQATHATSDMRWAEARLGPARVLGAYAWQRFLKLGLHVPNGSDFPVEEPDPLRGFHAAVTRQDEHANPPGGWQPDQRMSRAEALRSWTLDPAWAAFEEHSKGTLEPGKLADLVLLDKDIMTIPAPEILSTRVQMTIVGGRIVHQARP
jgi:predicted amidohydrolase YtcJ